MASNSAKKNWKKLVRKTSKQEKTENNAFQRMLLTLIQQQRQYKSIDQLLNERNGDPEEILVSLGFQSQEKANDLPLRVPERFLCHESSVEGISVRKYIEENPELKEYMAMLQSPEPTAMKLFKGPQEEENRKTFADVALTVTNLLKFASRCSWKRYRAMRDYLRPQESPHAKYRVKPYTGISPSGTEFTSILHPDNSAYLAKQGLYEDYSRKECPSTTSTAKHWKQVRNLKLVNQHKKGSDASAKTMYPHKVNGVMVPGRFSMNSAAMPHDNVTLKGSNNSINEEPLTRSDGTQCKESRLSIAKVAATIPNNSSDSHLKCVQKGESFLSHPDEPSLQNVVSAHSKALKNQGTCDIDSMLNDLDLVSQSTRDQSPHAADTPIVKSMGCLVFRHYERKGRHNAMIETSEGFASRCHFLQPQDDSDEEHHETLLPEFLNNKERCQQIDAKEELQSRLQEHNDYEQAKVQDVGNVQDLAQFSVKGNYIEDNQFKFSLWKDMDANDQRRVQNNTYINDTLPIDLKCPNVEKEDSSQFSLEKNIVRPIDITKVKENSQIKDIITCDIKGYNKGQEHSHLQPLEHMLNANYQAKVKDDACAKSPLPLVEEEFGVEENQCTPDVQKDTGKAKDRTELQDDSNAKTSSPFDVKKPSVDGKDMWRKCLRRMLAQATENEKSDSESSVEDATEGTDLYSNGFETFEDDVESNVGEATSIPEILLSENEFKSGETSNCVETESSLDLFVKNPLDFSDFLLFRNIRI